MKRALIGAPILVLIVWAAVAWHLEGTRLVLFCVAFGLASGGAAIYFFRHPRGLGAAPEQAAEPETPEAIELDVLLREANTRLRRGHRGRSLASLPLIYVVGDEGSVKTGVVLQAGIGAKPIAGEAKPDDAAASAPLASFWLADNCVFVEAGHTLLRDSRLWLRLAKATLPERVRPVFSRHSRLPARSAAVCVSIERIMAQSTSEQIRALAQSLNERLRQLSETLGASLPVYVLFTRLDTVESFTEYVKRFSADELKTPAGSVLSALHSASGLYSDQAAVQLGNQFDQLLYALSELRLEILSRGGDLRELAGAYEFPRDLRKLRAGIVSFLTEIARPGQTEVEPNLSGFFFSGMRNSVQPVFLEHLFSKILLKEKWLLEISRTNSRPKFLKHTLLATASALIFVSLTLATISFWKNYALERRVASAAAAPAATVSAGKLASLRDLQTLDNLRFALEKLQRYRKNGPPPIVRMGLYRGDALYSVACQVYTKQFRALLLEPAQENTLAKLRVLPAEPAPDSDYNATYVPLKAYLITVGDPGSARDKTDFLPSALMTEWAGNATPDANLARLAEAQFAFYASMISDPSSCMANAGGTSDDVVVNHARFYLDGFPAFEHVYERMLAAANHRFPAIDFNSSFPGSALYIVDNYAVQGAFSKDGFAWMQNAILNPGPYLHAEEWVIGTPGAQPIDRAMLSAQLRQAYVADYLRSWRSYLAKAQLVPYHSFVDARFKLDALDSNTSALLKLFSLISFNTGVAEPEIASAFQAPQSVVPASNPGALLISASNQGYIQSLQGLETAVKRLALNPAAASDAAAVSSVTQAAVAAEQAAETLRNNFVPDPAGSMDVITFNLLEAPIEPAKELAGQLPAGSATAVAPPLSAKH